MHDSLAIVGMACRLPGADGLDALWQLVLNKQVAWGRLPESRLPRDLYFHPEKGTVGKSYSELGAVVSDRPVDPRVCPITPELLARYDVAHHLFLEVASQACRDAGMDPCAMPADRRTGVYVGHTGGSTRIGDQVYSTGIEETSALLGEVEAARAVLGDDVERVAAEVTAAVRQHYPGRKPGEKTDLTALGAAKIVQEALRLDGPYLVVDAACASSLQAMAIGARAVLQGGIDQAIVGGASYCKSDSLVLFSAAQSVSNSGSCPFGREADGLVTAEGYVALVIKTLSRAVADGDRIRAVIRGIGVASDGKGKSLWAPRQEGQMLAVERAYPSTDEIGRLDYIEAHATSTQVGDATELGALATLMGQHLPPGKKIPIGSVKANIGHTLETAGMASLVKVVLAMEHGIIPPGSTCAEFSTEFDWQSGPFTVPLEAIAWPTKPDGGPRSAAVNAFGIGGLNVHVSLAQHVPGPRSSVRLPATPARDPEAEAIAIVGMGSVLPGALSLKAFYELLEEGGSALGPVPADRWNLQQALDTSGPRPWRTTAGLGGFVRDFQYDWRRHKVPPKQIAAANPLQFMLLEAADAALAEAGISEPGFNRQRTGVVVGTMFGGTFNNELQMGLRLPETAVFLRDSLRRRGISAGDVDRIIQAYEAQVLKRLPALVDETGSFTSSTLSSRLTKSFNLMGGGMALDAGDCSSLSAISAAADMLREQSCDTVLCAAGQRSLDLTAFEGLAGSKMLSDRARSIFSTSGSGRVPAEGAVVLVLKRLQDARAAGRAIHGVIRSVAVGAARSLVESAGRVVREACENSGLDPALIGALEACGCGIPERDQQQLAALAAHYGKGTRGSSVAGSLEGAIGHSGATAGAAAILKLARVLGTGQMPATLGCDSGASAGSLRVSSHSQPVPAADAAGYRAGCVTVMQDELVGHLILDNGLPVPAVGKAVAQPPRAERSPDANARGGVGNPLGVVAQAAAGTGQRRGLVAALFPGQGSQYTDMFRGLVAESAETRTCLEALDGLARANGFQTLAEVAWQPGNGLGTVVWDTQWAMYLGDLLAWNVLRGMGFAPDYVASHSFGEFPALAAVGAWSLADGARATQARAAAVEQFGPRDGAMLSVIADRQTVAAAIEPLAGQVWVCAENAPEQCVVGGTARAVDAVEMILEARRVKSKRLAVPSPFHTPLLKAAADTLAKTIQALPITAPHIAAFSSTTTHLLAGPAEIRESLIRQMTETVRWVTVIEKLYAAGVRTFVEVGPSGVLSGLARRILAGCADVQCVQFDARSRTPLEHLEKVREQLGMAGALRPTPPLPAAPPGGVAHVGVVSFDATARRRARNRAGTAVSRPASTRQTVVTGASHGSDEPTAGHGGNGNGWHTTAAEVSRRAAGSAARSPVVIGTNRMETLPRSAGTALEAGARQLAESLAESTGELPRPSGNGVEKGAEKGVEIEAFLIDFVVEQTGYPREIVELDADLESDLGIDSIRKAQLFGEIGQKHGLSADASVSLDDFRTLRHLLDYMLPRVGGVPVASAPAAGRFAANAGGSAAISNGHAVGEHGSAVSTNGHVAPLSSGMASMPPVASTKVASAGAAEELTSFLIDFVVEQTGYPRDIVELDADLESDLGIDSIRKAQLFGEIGQKHGLSADASVSLDDFRTLRHLLDYMLPRVGGVPVAPAPAAGGFATNGHGSAASTNGRAVPLSSGNASMPPVALAGAAEELTSFLIDFVVEQTGYPREIVELDADLESDLGIDSIRKAQLFGEIGQKHGLSADASVSLDDFRSLRHLLDYMLPRVGGMPVQPVSAAAVAPVIPVATPPSHSAAYQRARVLAGEQSGAIRSWARQFSGSPVPVGPGVADAALLEQLAGSAAGAGLTADLLQVALVHPEAACGGCDRLVVAPAAGAAVCGLAVSFGRHAQPAVQNFQENGLHGTLVGIPGLPGAMAGWNSAGLLVVADRASAAAVDSVLPVMVAIERLVRQCRTLEEFGQQARHSGPLSGGLIAMSLEGGGCLQLQPDGRLLEAGPVYNCGDSRAGMARIALADGALAPADGLAALLSNPSGGSPVAMSAACTWLAIGICGGTVQVVSGGPLTGANWLRSSPGDLGAAFVAAATRQRAVASEEQGETPATGVAATAPITRRYALTLQDLPATHASRALTGERVLILAAGALADPLKRAVEGAGAVAILCAAASREEAVAAIDAAEAQGAVRHLIVATPWTDGPAGWPAGRQGSIVAPYFACQRWIVLRNQAADLGRSTLTAITNLGGDFGLSGSIGGVESGALAGLFKGLAREFSPLHVRVVDCPVEMDRGALARAVLAEVRDGAGPVEVGYRHGRRQTVVPCERPHRGSSSAPPKALARGSVWLVTGGARGVTAACALELGRRHGVRLALVGSTRPAPVEDAWLHLDEAGQRDLKGRVMIEARTRGDDPRRAWNAVEKSLEIATTLRQMAAAGVQARYYACDLSDPQAVAALVAEVTRDLGPVQGIVHGAGYESACRFEKKTATGLEATLGPKCLGLEHLLTTVDPRTLECLTAFGSTSGRMGGHGQADYSLANDLLAKLVSQARAQRPGLKATVFHWHAWDEVGMASRPESRFVLEQFGLKFMPLVEGVQRFLDEVEQGLPEAEVLVTEAVLCPDAVVEGPSAGATAPATSGPRGSLVERVESGPEGSGVSFQLNPVDDYFLREHLQFGRPLLPAVMGAELLIQAALASGTVDRVEELRGFRVERPVGFSNDTPRGVRVAVKPLAGGSVEAIGWSATPVPNARTQGDERINFQAELFSSMADQITTPLDEPLFPFYPMVYQDDAPVWHGARFRTLNSMSMDRSGGWGKLTAFDPNIVAAPRGAAGWTVPIALLDGCLVGCAVYSYVMCRKRVEVPLQFESLRFAAQPEVNEKCMMRLFFRSQDARESVYDFILYGADGRPLIAIDGLHLAVRSERSRT